MGTNASILPDLKIGAWATIGINSAIVQNLPGGATAMGVPAEIVMMPKGQQINGSLPMPTMGRPKLKTVFAEPKTGIEKSIAEIWSHVLNVNNIGVNDNFFDLGGHSLSAVQVAFRIQKKLKVKLPLQTFFDNLTIAQLSIKIESDVVENSNNAELEKILNEIEGNSGT